MAVTKKIQEAAGISLSQLNISLIFDGWKCVKTEKTLGFLGYWEMD